MNKTRREMFCYQKKLGVYLESIMINYVRQCIRVILLIYYLLTLNLYRQQFHFPLVSSSFQVFCQSFDVKHRMVAPHLLSVGRVGKLAIHVVQNSFLSKCCLWSDSFAGGFRMQRVEETAKEEEFYFYTSSFFNQVKTIL